MYSGCEERIEVEGETNLVEIIEYSVTTTWHIPGYGTYQTYSKSGFYKDYPENAHNPRYNVSGNVKNIANRYLNKINLTILFCDSDMNELGSENIAIIDFDPAQIKHFTVEYYSNKPHFKNVENVKFHVST